MRGTIRVLLAVGVLASLAAAWRGQWAFQYAVPRAAGGWQLLAASAVLVALWVAARRPQTPPPAGLAADGEPDWREWLGAGALCGLGVLFRVVHFGSVPEGMNHDAAFNGMYALHVLQGAPYTPYVSAAWGRETLFMYLCTPLVAWLGNVPEPIQIAATLVGVATLPIFYLLARALLGRRVALIALAFFAVSGWHVVFSRVGWRMIMVAPFEMLALVGLWRAMQRGERRDWLLSGAAAALAIYTYDAGRVVPVMLGVFCAVFALIDRRRMLPRWRGAVVALVTFLIVGAPMLGYAATHFNQFTARAAHLADEHSAAQVGLLRGAVAAAAMFNYRGNGNDFFIEEPLLEPLTGALFVFGVLVLLADLLWSRPAWGRESAEPAPADAAAVRAPKLFVLLGLVVGILPGVISVPNGNRCIAALPFVYLIIALGADALAAAAAGALPVLRARRVAVPLLVALFVAIAAVETYREFLGAGRRPILGFSPDGTAAGEYMRRFGDDYARYVVAEDWPEYTLDYLSYNGGGTPMENHFVLGRRLEDIEERINRYGRNGMVFVTDLKPEGRRALERLQRLFAEHRIEPVIARRLAGAQVGSALIVEPQHSARSELWANTTRALAVGGDEPAAAVRCFEPIGDAGGASVHLQLMRPQVDGAAPAGEVRLLEECPPQRAAALTVGFGAGGLEVRTDHTVSVVAADGLEAGRWYEVDAILRADGTVGVTVDGHAVAEPLRLAGAAARPPRIAGIELRAPAGGRTFVDDIAVVPGVAESGDARREAARQRESSSVFAEDFEATPYGLLTAGGEWLRIDGPVSALASPAAAAPAAPAAAAAVPDAGNAFDGGHGAGAGKFDEPIGIAVDPTGNFYVADKSNHRIEKFARDGSFLLAWGEQGNGPGQFREPHDVAVDAEFVYVADTWNQRVQVFDHDGAHVFTITGEPTLSSPRGVFAKDHLIYIAEAGAGRVTIYDRAGRLRQSIGAQGGDAPGHLVEPVDVAVDHDGDIWVLNSGNNRLEHFAPDGTTRGTIPIPGWSGPRLKEVSLAIDQNGTFYVSDWDHGGVRRLRPDGSELPQLGADIKQPSGVAIDGDRVLVAARGENVIHVLPIPAGH